MQQSIKSFMYLPGGENEGGGADQKTEDVKPENPELDSSEKPHEKGFIEKVKDALRDWSNDDQQEQDADDSTP